VRKVFAEQLIVLVQLHPQLIVDLKKEFLEFVGNRVNVADGRLPRHCMFFLARGAVNVCSLSLL
jgi:hypothetical protein